MLKYNRFTKGVFMAAEDWYFNYVMKRATIDSYGNNVWYAIEKANNIRHVYLLSAEKEVLDLNFNKNAQSIEVGYVPKSFFSDKNQIPAIKRRATTSVYFVNGKFETIDEAIDSRNISMQELSLNSYEPDTELGVLKSAADELACGIINTKTKTIIARENIHKLASLSETGKLENVVSIAELIKQEKTENIINHFKSVKVEKKAKSPYTF